MLHENKGGKSNEVYSRNTSTAKVNTSIPVLTFKERGKD